MYANKIVAFVDIMGFKAAIEESELRPELAGDIAEALNTLGPRGVFAHLYGEPGEDADDEARALVKTINAGMARQHPIEISYFSDCVVISVHAANGPDGPAAMNLLELIARSMIALFVRHHFLLRGGIAFGQMYHGGGQAFGPAMVEAYEHENVAVVPRIMITDSCLAELSRVGSWDIWARLLKHDGAGANYMSLGTAFEYSVVNAPLGLYDNAEACQARTRANYLAAVGRCGQVLGQVLPPNIEEKYRWLATDLESVREVVMAT